MKKEIELLNYQKYLILSILKNENSKVLSFILKLRISDSEKKIFY
jgi:hypothetical protein